MYPTYHPMLSAEKIKFSITPTESRILIATSCFTVLPIYVAYHRALWLHALTSIGTMSCSILYWQHPVHGWRRNLDLIYAKYTFVVYLGSGIWYVPPGLPTFLFYLGAASIFQTYAMTYVYPHIWIRYHVVFHILSICVKAYILGYIPPLYSLQNNL